MMELVLLCSLLCSFLLLLIQTTWAHEGFVSIHSCAASNTTDPNTKINWISDINLFGNNDRKCKTVNDLKARIFGTDLGNKWCYNLATIKGEDYLIRGTFLNGSVLRSSADTFFNVSIDATSISQVNSSVDLLEVEAIFRANDQYINFCLVRGKGNAYISKLELRPLNDLVYLKNRPSSVLKVVKRVDLGYTKEVIRYPYDLNDRIWNVDTNQNGATPISSAVKIRNGANASVPLQVLQTALTDNERLEFVINDLETGDNNYMIILYFLELNNSISIGQRVFDIYVNGEKEFENFDILANDISTNYREIVLNVTANGVLNVTLIKVSNGAEFGPICNAYEILQIHSWVEETTLQEDVDAIVELKNELVAENPENELWESWSGDPCLPLPWQGLVCKSNNHGSFVVTNLDISGKGLRGSLPSTVSKLTYLKELYERQFLFFFCVIFIKLLGSIVDVSHNELIGPIPESISNLPHLARLYFRCNPQLKNDLPSSLLMRSNLTTDYGECDSQASSRSQRIFIGTVAGGSVSFTIAVGALFVCFYRKRMKSRSKLDEELQITNDVVFSIPIMDSLGVKSISIQSFSLELIETATNRYKTLIGEGGFGSVYRGTLPDGQEVAVKVRSATSTQGTREFENELNLLSAIQHENLVPLLGYCCESDQHILVYPFMSNGSLQDRLYGEAAKRKTLDWQTRLSVALGLLYLHTFAGRAVIHRDVKSSNILLDHSMTAKVADFGFSKYAPQEGESGASLEVRGTAGYLDPEYYSTQHLSAKSDVFSFGVVLLEIITGREPLDIHRPRNEWSLVEWAKPFIQDSRIEDMVDASIKAGYHAEAMWRVVEVALACLEPFSAYRPCMADIVRELEDALIIEINASEYMKSIDSFGGSNRFSFADKKIDSFGRSSRFSFADKKIVLPATPTPTEPSPIISQALAPPQPR
ncbi:Protein kinase domain [Macleaya cordata]|uniref:Protein kinase domain n=1 Tax=Macleaya cordata TaxID=56857 RepID=A0A200QHZ5_MACCD|nr:Protein kinase domain [Macleaya cordata]